MYKGDISNDFPKRVLVNADILLIKQRTVQRKLLVMKKYHDDLRYDKFLLNKFYVYTTRAGVTLELVSFDYGDKQLELIYNEMERVGINPFRYYSAYASPKKLIEDLPYRPEVVGVIDPKHQLMYGHWAIDF